MNMKTTKFLAVLAVLVMAFAAVAIIAPADSNDASSEVTPTDVATFDALKTAIGNTEVTAIAITGTFAITENIDLTKPVTINNGVTTTVSTGITMTVSSTLTVNGTLTVNEANAKITGTGTINGTAAPIVTVSQGTLENVTVSQASWAADQNTYPINVKDTTGAVTISGITVLLQVISETATEGTHGIGVYDIAEESTVTLKNIRFGAVNNASIATENLINIQRSSTFAGSVEVTGITVDSNVTQKATYGQLQVCNIENVGTNVTFDSSVTLLRIAGACTITKDVSVEKVVFKSGSDNKLTIAEGKTLKSDAVLAEGTSITLTNAGVSNNTTVGATFIGTVTYGDSVADIAIRAGSANVVIAAGSVTVTGTIGALDGSKIEQISGNVALDNLTVPEKTTLDIYGKLTGSISDAGTVNINTGADISGLGIEVSGEGKIVDNTDEDDMEELVIGGNSQGASTEFSSEQKVIVSSELGYWTLNSGSIVKINGVLVIPEGTIMTVQADAELIIQAGAKVHVYGELVLDAKEIGNAKAGIMTVNKGLISVEGDMTVNGELSLSATDAIISEIDVENGGRVIIGEAGKFTLDENNKAEFYVAAGGELLVYGTMGAEIYNSGMVIVDSEVAVTSSTKIFMWSPDASVDVRNYTIKASSTADLTITDEGLVFLTYKTGDVETEVTLKNAKDIIVIGMSMDEKTGTDKNDYSITFSGIEVVSGSTSASTTATPEHPEDAGIYNKKQYSKYLDVSGNFFVDYTYIGASTGSEQTVTATVDSYTEATNYAAYCAVKVTDAIVLNDNVVFTNKEGKLTVTGTIDAMSSKATVANTDGATIVVDKSGEISVIGGIINTENGINAAKFVTVGMDVYGKTYKIYNYYSIDGALAAVSSGVETTEIIILGSQTLTLSETLPDGITLVLSNSTASLTIKADVAFTIADTAVVKGEGTITVDGSMYAEEKTSVKGTVKVVSDVKTEELDEKGKPTKNGWALWTNLTDAIAAAEAGDVITITKKTTGTGYVTVSKNLTIPEGVTLVAPKDFDPLLLKNGVTLTIDGILVVGSNIYAQQSFALDAQNITGSTTDNKSRQSSAIVVNGALFSTVQVNYGNGYAAMKTDATNTSAIALFDGTYTTGATYTKNGTSAVDTMPDKVEAPIAGAYYTVKDGSTSYYVVSSLGFAAVLADEITSANITIHGDVSGLILDFEGTDVLKSIVIGTAANEVITTPTRTGAVATELTVANLALNDLTLNAINAFSGIVGNGTDAITLCDATGITVQDTSDKLYVQGELTLAANTGFAIVSAGTVYLSKAGLFTTDGILTIGDDATAVVGNSVDITGTLIVEGTFQVPANKTATITKLTDLGVVDVATTTETTAKGALTVKGDMFIGCSDKPFEKDVEFEIAYLNGPVTFDNNAVVYAMADAEFDLAASVCLLALNHTTYFVEDEEVFTMYASGAGVDLYTEKPKILDAVISGWVDENGKPISENAVVGEYDEIYADINYNIYSVMIVTDAGVKSVAINGIELVNITGNVFTLGTEGDPLIPLKAGTYKVTYTLKSGYQEDKNGVTLYTDDGTVLKDRSFVAGGEYGLTTIKLQLSGTEIIPEPEPVTPEEQSEWTITTILLVILVILIAIMAVIVALRLNRS